MAGLATVPAYGENHGWDIRPSPEPTVTSCEQGWPCRASSAVAVEEPWMVWLESDSNRHPYGSDTRSELCGQTTVSPRSTASWKRWIPQPSPELGRSRFTSMHGRPGPRPLCSDHYPEGLPDLCPEEAARVQRDNKAAAFVLERTRKFWQLLKSLRPSSVINPDVSFSFFHLNAYGLWARRMQLWSNQSKAPEGFVSSGWTNPVRPGRPL